ncbi:oligopeptide transporter [Colletotrichum tofieldiae]|nr:oligopeptide transporter [Colletotrichum tofieldiae]
MSIPPQGNVLPQAARVILYSVQNRFRLDSAEPAFQAEKYGRTVQWDNLFVSEIRRGLKACKVMACFVPFHLCMNQMATNLISQAGQMRLGGFPNDTVRVLNPIACILLGPAVQKVLYPTLQRVGVVLGPISRMTLAFAVMSAAMAFAAGVQKLIYTRGPCYAHPLSCPGSQGGIIPNAVSIWVQAPLYFILAFAEILGFTTLYQYSYSEAPKNMRSLVQALGQLSSGVGSALGMAVSPLSVDPLVLYLYAGLAVLMIMSAFAFALAFKKYDEVHEQQTGPA